QERINHLARRVVQQGHEAQHNDLCPESLPLHHAALECAAMAKIKRVGVLGCGLMGSGIAQVSAQAGYDTVVVEVEQKFLDKGLSGIDKSLGKFVEKGKLSAQDKDLCISRLTGSVSLKDLADCDIVVEAITE